MMKASHMMSPSTYMNHWGHKWPCPVPDRTNHNSLLKGLVQKKLLLKSHILDSTPLQSEIWDWSDRKQILGLSLYQKMCVSLFNFLLGGLNPYKAEGRCITSISTWIHGRVLHCYDNIGPLETDMFRIASLTCLKGNEHIMCELHRTGILALSEGKSHRHTCLSLSPVTNISEEVFSSLLN